MKVHERYSPSATENIDDVACELEKIQESPRRDIGSPERRTFLCRVLQGGCALSVGWGAIKQILGAKNAHADDSLAVQITTMGAILYAIHEFYGIEFNNKKITFSGSTGSECSPTSVKRLSPYEFHLSGSTGTRCSPTILRHQSTASIYISGSTGTPYPPRSIDKDTATRIALRGSTGIECAPRTIYEYKPKRIALSGSTGTPYPPGTFRTHSKTEIFLKGSTGIFSLPSLVVFEKTQGKISGGLGHSYYPDTIKFENL